MKYEVTKQGDPTEALGAYSGYRIRLVATRSGAGGAYAVRGFFRGSESMPEKPVPVTEAAFDTAEQALDFGYASAVEWIDREDGVAREG